MSHNKVYGFCENLCEVEVPNKNEFDNAINEINSQQLSFITGSISGNSEITLDVTPKFIIGYRKATNYQEEEWISFISYLRLEGKKITNTYANLLYYIAYY